MSGGTEPLGVLELTRWAQGGWGLLAQRGPRGDAAQCGRHGELGERGLFVSEGFVSVDPAVLDDALLAE